MALSLRDASAERWEPLFSHPQALVCNCWIYPYIFVRRPRLVAGCRSSRRIRCDIPKARPMRCDDNVKRASHIPSSSGLTTASAFRRQLVFPEPLRCPIQSTPGTDPIL